MKMLLRGLIIPIFLIGMCNVAQAQTPSSKIMDAGVSWTNPGSGVDGSLQVFLTDTIGLAGLTVNYGSTDSSANYFSGTYMSLVSFVSAGGTIQDGQLSIPIGHFSQSVTGHLRISVLLVGGGHNDIAVMK